MFSKNARRVRRLNVECEALECRNLQAVAFHSLGQVMLNPQPLPPRWNMMSSECGEMLNPQPLPPGD